MWWQEIGPPGPEHTIIFNGDFIDRGAYGLEVLMILLAFKVAAPEAVHLNRGNHGDRMLATVYGFKNECVAKTNEHIWQRICGLFPLLPLGAVVEDPLLRPTPSSQSLSRGRCPLAWKFKNSKVQKFR